ncbi:hypothetical protein ANAPH2_01427 [Anaplasma phagocytophilum]|nr:hypothetical protein ANAPH2_01427 [Anaplasma phagocytophilum]
MFQLCGNLVMLPNSSVIVDNRRGIFDVVRSFSSAMIISHSKLHRCCHLGHGTQVNATVLSIWDITAIAGHFQA